MHHLTTTRRRRPSLHCVLLLLAVATSLPRWSLGVDAARGLRTEVDAVYTVWSRDDVCSQPMEPPTDCKRDVSCSACLTRDGCAVESTTGKCVSTSRIVNTTTDVEYFLAGESQYCAAKDAACRACVADNSDADAVCRGVSGCVCVHQCELASASHASDCDASQSSFNWYYVLIAAAILTPAVIMKLMYKSLTSGILTRAERRELERAVFAAKPLTMKLDGWRSYIEKEFKDSSTEKIELSLCPTRASSDDQSRRLQSEASTMNGDDDEYVAVATPKPGDTTRGRSV